jgi:Protein of unknown function (DUF3455)
MTNYMRCVIAAGIIAVGFDYPHVMAQGPFSNVTAPPVPNEIKVPPGNAPFLKGYAEGTQNYVCLPAPSGVAWKLYTPQATLFLTFRWFNGDVRQQITTHFLSSNPAEGGLARPTWQHSLDTSKVWAKALASSGGSNSTIPLLLLQIVGAERGPIGGTGLTSSTYIQRLNTTGGVAPQTGCTEPGHVGNSVFVPYTADYLFYRKE